MVDPNIESALRALGAEPERAGESLMLRRLPAKLEVRGISGAEGYYIIGQAAPDAHIAESGTILLAGAEVPIHRCLETPALRPHAQKIAEERGNLSRRAGWFQKRSG